MKFTPQQIEEAVPISSLSTHPKNPRQGDVGAIHQSIEANGFYGVIVAQKSTGHILAGNHRYKAALQSGAETIPVCWLDVDDERALKVLLADNRLGDMASYDTEGLVELLKDLYDSSGLEGTGYSADDLDDLMKDLDGPKMASAFKEVTEDLETDFKCPKCSYEWSGKAR